MTITENKHTITYKVHDSATTMFINNDMISEAPAGFKAVMDSIAKACMFVEQFALSAHFVTGVTSDRKPTASCYTVIPIEKDAKKVLEERFERFESLEGTHSFIPPSLAFCLYAGLRLILDCKMHLGKALLLNDTTSIVNWDKHHVVDVCMNKGENDITTGVFIFEDDDKHCLNFVGSYSSMEDKIINEEGDELDVPPKAKQRITELYGKELLEKQIRDIMGNKEGN